MEPECTAPEVYTNFVKHVDRVRYNHPVFDKLATTPRSQQDYENCKVAADYIAYQLLGMLDPFGKKVTPSYWKKPEFEGMSPIQIEVKIIREQERINYGLETKYNRPCYQHALELRKLIFPETDTTPLLADIVQLFSANFTHGRKCLHL